MAHVQLVEHGHVVQNPEGAALRRYYQFPLALVEGQVRDRHHRQILLERLPVGAVV
jgi:hypothetical protein